MFKIKIKKSKYREFSITNNQSLLTNDENSKLKQIKDIRYYSFKCTLSSSIKVIDKYLSKIPRFLCLFKWWIK